MKADDIKVVYMPSRIFEWWVYDGDYPLECFSFRWTAEAKANKLRRLIREGIEVKRY